jgi:carotenoid cleavage dioxygenase
VTGEAVFVPDPDRSSDEDGGWLMSIVYDAEADTSDFVIVDAQDVRHGPVASVTLPQRVPFGFHGNWIAQV